jgi:hypothetical protein
VRLPETPLYRPRLQTNPEVDSNEPLAGSAFTDGNCVPSRDGVTIAIDDPMVCQRMSTRRFQIGDGAESSKVGSRAEERRSLGPTVVRVSRGRGGSTDEN